MPLNLLVKYDSLLSLLYRTHNENLTSLRSVYSRDFVHSKNKYKGLDVFPTPADNKDAHEREFWHLTTVVTNSAIKKREFQNSRSVRIHWIKPHLQEQVTDKIIAFKVASENRVYILNKKVRYVIILEPRRDLISYYLITAYDLYGSGYKKIMDKLERIGEVI